MKSTFAKVKNPIVLRVIIGIVLIVALVGGYLFYQTKVGRVGIENSLIEAPTINIVSPTTGVLSSIPVHEGQMVTKGDALAVVGSNTLRADSDGLVTSISQDTGSTVGPTSALMQMINPDHLRVDGTIDENKGLDQIKVGQVASFTVDAFPGKTYWGYVDEISPSAKQTQMSFSISSERPTQQFQVYVRFNAHKYPEIKNGMSAKITVYTKSF
jgi:multidrug resistance efflux pump